MSSPRTATRQQPPLTTTRESLCAATKTSAAKNKINNNFKRKNESDWGIVRYPGFPVELNDLKKKMGLANFNLFKHSQETAAFSELPIIHNWCYIIYS